MPPLGAKEEGLSHVGSPILSTCMNITQLKIDTHLLDNYVFTKINEYQISDIVAIRYEQITIFDKHYSNVNIKWHSNFYFQTSLKGCLVSCSRIQL